jgi:hypothetical protein
LVPPPHRGDSGALAERRSVRRSAAGIRRRR